LSQPKSEKTMRGCVQASRSGDIWHCHALKSAPG
jgi:hypothetical protein